MATHTEARATLEAGDNLTREEFHRRYLARPDIRKAELIDGVVYVPPPVSIDRHAENHLFVATWLGTYLAAHRELRGGDNGTVLLDAGEHEVQPDAFLWRPEEGEAYLNQNSYLVGAPQLVVEVAASSVSYDLHQKKKEAYRLNGAAEYVVWRVEDRAIDWFRLRDGAYVLVEPGADGLVESE
jgi:Uma2 family endonuclease